MILAACPNSDLISMQNADQNHALNVARIEQQKADEKVLTLLEKQKVCTTFHFLLISFDVLSTLLL
jgi:hypothetical protein